MKQAHQEGAAIQELQQSLNYLSECMDKLLERNAALEASVEHEKRRADNLYGRRIYELEAALQQEQLRCSNFLAGLEPPLGKIGINVFAMISAIKAGLDEALSSPAQDPAKKSVEFGGYCPECLGTRRANLNCSHKSHLWNRDKAPGDAA